MAKQHVAIRALNRSANIRVVNADGDKVKLKTDVDTVVDLDLASNRRELLRHGSVGQYIVTAAHANDNTVALPANEA